MTGNDSHRATAWTGLNFRPDNAVADEVRPSIGVGRIWNWDGVRKDQWISPELGLLLKRQTWASVSFLTSDERFREAEFGGIRRWQFNVESDFSELLGAGAWFSTGSSIARNLDTPVLGDGFQLSLWGTFKPLQRLVIEPQYDYAKLDYPDGGENVFDGYILRTRVNFQYSRELFLRLILQYNKFGDSFDLEPLISYKINPFTVFFLGSTHDFRNFAGPTDLTQTERQFFFKFQYLLRS